MGVDNGAFTRYYLPMTTNTNPRYRIHRITDDVTHCDCCGRTDLKRTVQLLVLDTDGNAIDTVYFGTDCAARATGRDAQRVKIAARTGADLEFSRFRKIAREQWGRNVTRGEYRYWMEKRGVAVQ